MLTGIANLDSFVSVSELGDETFVMANEGITNIHTTYAYFKEGLICSILGFLLLMPVMIYTCVAYPMDGYVHTPLMLREEKPDKKVSEEQTEETPEKVTSQDMSFIDKEYMDMMEDEEKEGVEKSEENADINIEKSKQAENAGGSDENAADPAIGTGGNGGNEGTGEGIDATADAEPPDEPPGTKSSPFLLYGFLTSPK